MAPIIPYIIGDVTGEGQPTKIAPLHQKNSTLPVSTSMQDDEAC